MKPNIAIIGGSGMTSMTGLSVDQQRIVKTPFGEASAPIVFGRLEEQEVAFLARHGQGHTIAPHRVNYRANIYALADIGARAIIAVAAVGGIGDAYGAGRIVIPDQIIDYTHSRDLTYFDGDTDGVTHVDFSYPYNEPMRQVLLQAAVEQGVDAKDGGTYAATQGPRFETAREIDRIERDGGNIVGMTGMPEAVLARELNLAYATIALVVNPAAGRSKEIITLAEINNELERGMTVVRNIVATALPTMTALVASEGT